MDMFRLGLVVNPLAGLGGPVALKGSDGVAAEALARGAEPRALERTRIALECLLPLVEKIEFLTFPGAMGGELLERMGFRHRLLGEWQGAVSSAADTRLAVERLQEAGVALILFAGGDGTARDVAGVVREQQPVLGIPAGVKIHSGVYAISPRAAGELARRLVEGGLVRLASGEVRDLDEEALRAGRVAARWYGEMTVPEEGHFMQHVKQAGMESEELVLVDLADWLAESWEDGVRYVLGPGSTLHGLARNLGLETTLLGVDVLENGAVLARDVDEARLFELVDGHPAFLLVTAIGGQGHVIGRGNQQISPRVLRAIGLERMRVVATKRKLGTLGGRPLLVDSGDPVLDDSFPDAIRVWAGYKEELLYPLGYAKDQDTPAGARRKRMDKDVSGALRRLLLLAMLGLPLAAAAAVEPQRLVDAARAQVGVTLGYDPAYRQLDYPGGDVPLQTGVCTDVVVRALRGQGLDLQKAVHEDMRRHFAAYPQQWGMKGTDRNIDHRRVPNLMTWFSRQGLALTPSRDASAYRAGDIVAWRLDNGLLHIGVLSDRRLEGRPLVLHNIGAGVREEDLLFRYQVIGHYRFPQG